jgi:two-component system, sensor histidine kinase RpfC
VVGARENPYGRAGAHSSQRGGAYLPTALHSAEPTVLAAIGALAFAAAMPPVAFVAFAPIGSAAFKIVLVGVLTLAPALVGVATALLGLEQVLERFHGRSDKEHEQAILRIFWGTALLGYVFAASATSPASTSTGPCLVTVSLALAAGWLLLLQLILNPAPAPLRRGAAALGDVVVLSAFLHFGGAIAAPWFGTYLLVTFYSGFRFGLRALWITVLLSLAGFAATVETTVFWQQQPSLTAGVVLALIMLPVFVAALIRDIAVSHLKVDEAHAAKDRFLAVLGRELRGPINAMIGMHVATAAAARESGAAASALQLAARALLSQVNDILDFSQIEAGNFAPKTEAFDLHGLVNETLAILREQAAAKGLALALRVDPDLPYRLRGWPHQLRRILTNTVSHAIKATDRGRVRVALDQIGRDDRTLRLRLSIRDDAPGLDPNARDAIFDPFAADREAQEPRWRGDLGLVIARRLVALMDGEIEVESEPGRGNLFAISLPFAVDHATAEKALDLGHRSVLIVTDDTQFASDLAEPLNAWQGDVRWVGMSEAALDCIERFDPPEPRPIVIIDGRREVLEALTFAHRAVTSLSAQPTFALFVAEPPWIDALIELADGELAGLLPWPLTDRVLGNALHALPLGGTAADDGVAPPAAAEWSAPVTETKPAVPRRRVVDTSTAAAGVESSRTASVAAPDPRVPPTPARRLRVLVADDDTTAGERIGDILADRGHDVYRVLDGEDALRSLEASVFDVALMSIEMPRLTGYEAARLYRMGHFDEPRLPIIALTSEPGGETERLCREAGMDAVVVKPVETVELIAAIEDAVAVVGDLAARSAGRASTVTPIAAHPRFVSENSPIVDERAVEALRSLGAGSDFFRDVIESFRLDSRQMLQRISRAAASADTGGFRESVHALRSCAANVGGVRLCDMLLALRDVTARELRQQGTAHVQRLTAELARLDVVLLEFLQGAEEGRR